MFSYRMTDSIIYTTIHKTNETFKISRLALRERSLWKPLVYDIMYTIQYNHGIIFMYASPRVFHLGNYRPASILARVYRRHKMDTSTCVKRLWYAYTVLINNIIIRIHRRVVCGLVPMMRRSCTFTACERYKSSGCHAPERNVRVQKQ